MSTEDKPKIIVDDDWKTRVQTEKEQSRSPPADPTSEPQRPASAATRNQNQNQNQKPEERLPAASFESLISMLVTQALAALGQIPLGDNREPVVMLDHAKHYIDLLGVLEEKTTGNLSTAEAGMVTNVLHELRMIFVAMQSRC